MKANLEYTTPVINLQLTPEEFICLWSILRRVGGHPDTTARKYIDPFHKYITEILVKNSHDVKRWIDEFYPNMIEQDSAGSFYFTEESLDLIARIVYDTKFVQE